MSIKCSEVDNYTISTEFFNWTKLTCEELSKFIKGYRQLIFDFNKKLIALQSTYKKKVLHDSNQKMNSIISVIDNLTNLIEQIHNKYQISIAEIDKKIKDFDNIIKLKSEELKSSIKLTQEYNKMLINCETDTVKAKNNYMYYIGKTEEVATKYYNNKNKIKYLESVNSAKSDNELSSLMEQQKNLANEMQNNIKNTKKTEKAYQDSINTTNKFHGNFFE